MCDEKMGFAAKMCKQSRGQVLQFMNRLIMTIIFGNLRKCPHGAENQRNICLPMAEFLESFLKPKMLEISSWIGGPGNNRTPTLVDVKALGDDAYESI